MYTDQSLSLSLSPYIYIYIYIFSSLSLLFLSLSLSLTLILSLNISLSLSLSPSLSLSFLCIIREVQVHRTDDSPFPSVGDAGMVFGSAHSSPLTTLRSGMGHLELGESYILHNLHHTSLVLKCNETSELRTSKEMSIRKKITASLLLKFDFKSSQWISD